MNFFLILWFRIVRFHVYVSNCDLIFFVCLLLFLDFWKKNEKNKINFPYCGKNVDEARFDFGLRSRRKTIGGKTGLQNSR